MHVPDMLRRRVRRSALRRPHPVRHNPWVNLHAERVRLGNYVPQRVVAGVRSYTGARRFDRGCVIGIRPQPDFRDDHIHVARLGVVHHCGRGGRALES